MKLLKILARLFLFLFLFYSCKTKREVNPALQKIIIIRHAERPDTGDNLSCQGLNRALQLPAVLYSKFQLADYIYVPFLKSGKTTNVSRMFQTVVPYAVKYNKTINTKYDVKDEDGLATEIMKKKGTILVCWQHNSIIDIVKALGVKEKNLQWDDDDYNSIWIVTYDNGKATLARDTENLTPGIECY